MLDKIFFFNIMITPKIITFIFWLMLAGTAVTAISMMIVGNFFIGLATLVSGFIFSRIWCELLIVLFKIHENIHKMANPEQRDTSDKF